MFRWHMLKRQVGLSIMIKSDLSMARLTAPIQRQGDKDADRKPCQYVGKSYAIAMF